MTGIWPGRERAWTFLAPMEGVTHPAFRALIARRPGLGVVCTEFVRIASTPVGEKHLRRQVVRAPGVALSVQVMGRHREHLAEATEIVARAGADIVDLNVGCPAPRAVRKGVGSALLQDHELLGSVVSAMRGSTSGCLSAKIRAGFDDASGATRVARVIEQAGADFISVHPRRRVDFYRGVADWRIIRAIKRTVSIPVVGNGDVWYARDALRMRQETGCDGVMIGRGALRNPWIFEQIDALLQGKEPTAPCGARVLAHCDELRRMLLDARPQSALGMLKEQLRYLARSVDDGGALMRSALRASDPDQLMVVLERALSALGPECLDLAALGGTLERSGRASPPDGGSEEEARVERPRPIRGAAGRGAGGRLEQRGA